jgi:Eukaryotic translation initiation factor 3 subunit 8 N-terminus
MSRFFRRGGDSSDESSSDEEEELLSGDDSGNEIIPKPSKRAASGGSEESPDSNDSDDSDDSDEREEEKPVKKVSRFLKTAGSDSEDSDDESVKHIVKSAKDKRMEEMATSGDVIDQKLRINDWAAINTGMTTPPDHACVDFHVAAPQNSTNSPDSSYGKRTSANLCPPSTCVFCLRLMMLFQKKRRARRKWMPTKHALSTR